MKTNKAHQLLENVLVGVASNWCVKACVKGGGQKSGYFYS